MKNKKGEHILEFLVLLLITSIIINSMVYFIYKNILNIYIILLSLFLVGILILILIFKFNDENKYYNNYIVLEKDEYEILKNDLIKQKIKLKKQNRQINKIKAILK